MTILIVEHDTPVPALDGMIAGEIAAERHARFATLVSGGAGLGWFDCVQHVLAHGELAPNGLLWAERASGSPLAAPVDRGAVAGLAEPAVVVALNPGLAAHREAAERIRAGAARLARPLERFVVAASGAGFVVRSDAARDPATIWSRDKFGRPSRGAPVADAAPGGNVRILIVGDETLQRDVYPGNVAALGDAAENLGLGVTLSFIDPREIGDEAWPERLAGVDGVVLPGGSDMEQVRGQIAAARATLAADLPTLGLCLGMQSMCTAVAQVRAGLSGANLAEADPEAPIKTFIRLHDASGRPEFRLGERMMRVESGTRLAAWVGSTAMAVRYNHRFVLDPALHEPLLAAGLRVCGWQNERDLVDAIEVEGQRFYTGLQGHPELSSRRGSPHPVFSAFLKAARDV